MTSATSGPAEPSRRDAAATNDDGLPLLDPWCLDPAGLPPLGDEQQFAATLEGMVADCAPRMFAVVQEYGRRVDARIAAWGLAGDDHADAFGVDRSLWMKLQAPDDALPAFIWGDHITTRLVWVNPNAATPVDE